MNYVKTSEKLDLILGYLKNHLNIELTTGAIAGYIKLITQDAIPANELQGLLKILANDRHIKVITPGLYVVTFEGTVFIEDGGYSTQRQGKLVKRQYIRYAKHVGDESSNIWLWVIGILLVLVVYFVFRYAYLHWNWKIPV